MKSLNLTNPIIDNLLKLTRPAKFILALVLRATRCPANLPTKCNDSYGEAFMMQLNVIQRNGRAFASTLAFENLPFLQASPGRFLCFGC